MAAAKYTHEQADTDHSQVCAEAGRKCVRSIHQHPILSGDWLALVDSLKQLTRLVQLEGRMPANAKVSEGLGRDRESSGTLWDQEAHENAIRILVEEAKVNLCLRMMQDYKRWQQDPEKQRALQETSRTLGHSEASLEGKCRQFEESLGILLWRAFTHVETLQLMDIPLLIEHISQVLLYAKRATPEALADRKMQETVVLYYLHSLCKHAESLQNAELLARLKELHVVPHAVQHVLGSCSGYAADTLLTSAEAFAFLADNEDFKTDWESFFPTPEAKGELLQLEARVLEPLLAQNAEHRRALRPLTDFFNTVKRSMR